MSSPFLAVDLGSTSARATCLSPEAASDDRPRIDVVPTAIDPDAESASANPSGTMAGLMTRFGDPTPQEPDHGGMNADDLVIDLFDRVVREADVDVDVDASHSAVALVVPPTWGDFRREHLARIPRRRGFAYVTTITAAEAIGAHYARGAQLTDGALAVVYDVGGHSSSCAVVRRVGGRMEIVGHPDGVDHLGGVNLDDALMEHLDQQSGGVIARHRQSDPAAFAAVRRRARTAREALSTQLTAQVSLAADGVTSMMSIRRSELETVAGPALRAGRDLVDQTLDLAGVRASDVSAVVAIGGLAWMPAVIDQLRDTFSCPVVRPDDPATSAATSATWWLMHEAPIPRRTVRLLTTTSHSTGRRQRRGIGAMSRLLPGTLVGAWWRSPRMRRVKIGTAVALGVGGVAAGLALAPSTAQSPAAAGRPKSSQSPHQSSAPVLPGPLDASESGSSTSPHGTLPVLPTTTPSSGPATSSQGAPATPVPDSPTYPQPGSTPGAESDSQTVNPSSSSAPDANPTTPPATSSTPKPATDAQGQPHSHSTTHHFEVVNRLHLQVLGSGGGIAPDAHSRSQQWELRFVANRRWQIINRATGTALTAKGTRNGAGVTLTKLNAHISSQLWSFPAVGDGRAYIRNARSGKVLDVPGDDTATGHHKHALRLWSVQKDSIDQRWSLHEV